MGWVYVFWWSNPLDLVHDTKWGGGGGTSKIFQNLT